MEINEKAFQSIPEAQPGGNHVVAVFSLSVAPSAPDGYEYLRQGVTTGTREYAGQSNEYIGVSDAARLHQAH